MSNLINDGGPAFPDPLRADPSETIDDSQLGMSLRDYFAGQALVACMDSVFRDDGSANDAAPLCYKWADAMLKAREVQS